MQSRTAGPSADSSAHVRAKASGARALRRTARRGAGAGAEKNPIMATLAGRRPSPRTHSLFVLLMSLSYANGLRTSLLPMSQWIFPQAESVTSQSQTSLNTNDCSINSKGRRDLMKGALLGASLFTASMIPAVTFATTSLVQPPQELLLQYDLPRDPRKDAGFAQGMATGMRQYESAVAAKKEALFKDLLQSLPESPVVLELGI
eukprot:2253712-Pleurochrysis_carterae.AAC.2